MRFYYYFFYRWYSIIRRLDKVIPEWYASAQCKFLCIFMTMSMSYIVAPGWTKSWFEVKGSLFDNLLLTMLFFTPNYFLFIYNKRYKIVVKMFEGESKRKRIIGNVLLIVFVLLVSWAVVEIQMSVKR